MSGYGAMSDCCWRCVQQEKSQDTLAFFLIPLNLRSRFTHHLLHIVMNFFIFKILSVCYCPRRNFAQKAKSRGGTLVTSAYIKGVLTVEIYSQYARKYLDLLEQGPRGYGR